ncbi:Rano class II histocompatibility antigen, partial [Lamprotornis superbus]
PSSSQPGPGCLLCSVMDFYPAEIQLSWFQGQQELSGHVVATDLVPNGDWISTSSWCCWKPPPPPPARGQLQLPVPERQPDTTRSKVLRGIGGSVLGVVFLALGLGFYGDKKVGGSRGSCSPSAVKLPS